MSTTSTLPAVKAALVANLKLRPGLAGVQVSNGHPGATIAREAIFTNGARGEHEIAALKAGRKPRDEEYTVDVIVYVQKAGGTIVGAEERAFELLAELENELADDPKLGTSVLLHATAGEFEVDSGYFSEGADCAIRLGVKCRARLT